MVIGEGKERSFVRKEGDWEKEVVGVGNIGWGEENLFCCRCSICLCV